MLPEQKAKLKFNPYALSARIAVPNSFKPLCANGNDLITLTKLNKMAYVTDHRTGIVHLDCTNYSLTEWQTLFNSQKLEEKPFFLHEALRVLNIENEDDYNISSSIIAATMADPNYEKKMVANMMANLLSKQNPMCSIQISKDSVVFYVKDQIADGAKAFTTSWQAIEDVRAVLIDSTGSANVNDPFDDKALIGFKNRVFVRATEVGCY